jgi:hypothetical protein
MNVCSTVNCIEHSLSWAVNSGSVKATSPLGRYVAFSGLSLYKLILNNKKIRSFETSINAQWCSLTSQKKWIFSNTARRASNHEVHNCMRCYQSFVRPEISLPNSQPSVTSPYPEPDESIPHFYTPSLLTSNLLLFSHVNYYCIQSHLRLFFT